MIENVALFSDLSEPQLAEVEAIGKLLLVPKNTVVINEGDQTDNLYVVLRGKAYALRNDDSGRQLVVNTFGPDDYFGEMSFFDGEIRCASVVTKESSKLMVIQRNDFQLIAARHPELFWNVTRALIQKLRKATEQIEELAFKDVYSRLSRFLAENKEADGVLKEKYTQQELADIVGTTRESICRLFLDLTAGGYIGKKDERIVLLKDLPYKLNLKQED